MDQPQDVVTGNPTVIKMVVNFYRHANGQNPLRDSLGPALQDVLLDKSLSIRTDPVDVYKTWINQTETQTGLKRSELRNCSTCSIEGSSAEEVEALVIAEVMMVSPTCQIDSDPFCSLYLTCVCVAALCPMKFHLWKL